MFYNFNIIEEVQVGGVGAPAEYGGFSGAVVNTITKSGGNRYSGLFDIRHTNDGLAGNNVPKKYLDLNPALGAPNVMTSLNDFTVQMGGPFSRDKAFWWFSVKRYAFEQDPAGPSTIRTEISPRYNGKITWNITPSDTLSGSLQYDNYNVTGRFAWIPSYAADETQTVNQDSPEAVWNIQYRKLFGSSSFLEAKYMGYWGYYYLDPVRSDSARFDGETGAYLWRRGLHLLRGPRPEPGEHLLLDVRQGGRRAQFQVRDGDRAEWHSKPVRPDERGVLLRLRGPVPGLRLQLRHEGHEQTRVVLRPGSVADRPPDGQPRSPPGSHLRVQPRIEQDNLRSRTRLGPTAWCDL